MKSNRNFFGVRVFLGLLSLAVIAPTARAQSTSAGLWIGTASLDQVTDPKGNLSRAGGVFEFRILFHVSTAGAVKVLKDVMVIQYDHDNNPATAPVLGLVTDPAKLPMYRLVTRTDGRSNGIRYSASAYDFAGLDLAATGGLAAEQSLQFTLETAANSPTNPFRHKFNPEHATGLPFTRAVTVNFKGATASETSAGATRITGTYKEIISNLVKYDIQLTGTVTLDRISPVGTLNP